MLTPAIPDPRGRVTRLKYKIRAVLFICLQAAKSQNGPANARREPNNAVSSRRKLSLGPAYCLRLRSDRHSGADFRRGSANERIRGRGR